MPSTFALASSTSACAAAMASGVLPALSSAKLFCSSDKFACADCNPGFSRPDLGNGKSQLGACGGGVNFVDAYIALRNGGDRNSGVERINQLGQRTLLSG